ncbi:MAG: hypothetical protein DRO12_02280 [Thermoprotei archaeon]|nr:MAG: hypothetical protein DRO12_02280 [Thermoprotei archaeon]
MLSRKTSRIVAAIRNLGVLPPVEKVIKFFSEYGLTLTPVGYGWCGEPIYVARLGSGARSVLLTALVDPDEPVGLLTLQFLVTEVIDRQPELLKRFTWYLVPAADPCGAKLNENWFSRPYDLRLYILERFKVKVVEWYMPGSCGDYIFKNPTPEALAFKRVIDLVKPDFLALLHSNDFKGVRFFLSKRIPQLMYKLKSLVKMLNLQLHRGDDEAHNLEVYEDGFYRMPTLCDVHLTCLEGYGLCKGVGETIYGYSRHVNPKIFALSCETPFVYSRLLEDAAPSGEKLRGLYMKVVEDSYPIACKAEQFLRLFAKEVKGSCPHLWEAIEYIEEWTAELRRLKTLIARSDDYSREATKAEEFSVLVVKGMWDTLLKLGILMRIARRCRFSTDLARKIEEELDAIFEERYSELTTYPIEYIPLEKQVLMQLRSIMLSVETIFGKRIDWMKT